LLTGQYAHNTGVYTNLNGGPFPGGISAFDDSRTIATVLNRQLGDQHITTGYIGKYLNGYKAGTDGEVRGTYVPPGWDRWRASIAGEYRYTGMTTYSFNGRYVDIPGYETTVQTDLAASFIKNNSGRTPWMLLLNYFAPHNTVESRLNVPLPESAHAHDYDGARAPRGPAYNEPDMSDKPAIAQRPRMSAEERRYTDNLAEARYEALASVDDGMMRLRRALRAAGVASDTNIIFLSDNGYLLGDHRVRHNKVYGYEPSAKIPLFVSGSGFAGGRTSQALVGLHDIASTVTGTYGLGAMPQADGIGLAAVLNGHARNRDLLLRGVFGSQRYNYTGIRTPNSWKYIEYAGGGSELYNLVTDPAEVESLAGRPKYADLQADLAHRLRLLRDCAGQTCR
jgi:arylsulfatase A-like enzyme